MAGIAGSWPDIAGSWPEEPIDDELLTSLIKVNVEGTTKVTQAVLPGMVMRKKGAIVNIGSGAAIVIPSDPFYAVYAATKP
ncbi:hypothetical protein CTI12_AA574000 [Artemisia annua]|uniref:Uncharacterized protein n=1 Tax=Artemisia annua TaxID=35608 RepID=A0A2U1KQV0_ARTAN|nr:hypothetical protein CTI12_AA574000 [Artemisia annua]